MHAAALYLRSSKDRSDVSIDAQRRELLTLAQARGLPVLAEYADAVESGATDQRPAFQRLLRDLRAPDRAWDHLLLVDTSRLSRRRYLAQAFKHEARRRGITVLYSRVPETDPITSVILESVFEAMDEVHSLMSREKGIAGMRENVAQGFRAGGRAPAGYRLRLVETGAIRDGERVTKSVLEPSEDAPRVRRYLKARAAGASQARAGAELGLPRTTLNGMEWNALTYAGHTVWGVHAEAGSGRKRRPRAEWQVQRDTHPALIDEAEAEAILAQLERGRRRYRTPARFLLAGLLVAPDGRAWHGDQDGAGTRAYKLRAAEGRRGRTALADDLEAAVLGQLAKDLCDRGFAEALVAAARAHLVPTDTGELARKQVDRLTAKIARMMELAGQMSDAAPALREIEKLERERKAAAAQADEAQHAAELAFAVRDITIEEVQGILGELAARLADARDAEALKDQLGVLLEAVVLDPDTLVCTVRYRAVLTGEMVASPRGAGGFPGVASGVAYLPRRRRR